MCALSMLKRLSRAGYAPCAMGADIRGTARLEEVQLSKVSDSSSQNPGFSLV